MELKVIEKVLPRLRYGTTASKVMKWLENFDKEDRVKLFSLLKVFEFITYNELLYRYELLFKQLLESIIEGDKLLIIPYGKFGKSSTMMTYPLSNTPSFKNYNKGQEKIVIENDYRKIVNFSKSDFQHIIFLDDFVGSGKTFIDECNNYIKKGEYACLKGWFAENEFKSVMLLSCVIMLEGKRKIEHFFPSIRIYGDIRDKIFDNENSPLAFYETLDELKNIVLKYDSNKNYKLGFNNSQAVISFYYGTPNNTLGVFWNKFSLFHRFSKCKLSSVKELREDFQFYEPFLDKINFQKDTEKINLKESLLKNEINFYLFIAFLFMKAENYADIYMESLLSISSVEMIKLKQYCINEGYYENETLSVKGGYLLEKIKSKSHKENFREPTQENLKIDKNTIFMPRQIKGNR